MREATNSFRQRKVFKLPEPDRSSRWSLEEYGAGEEIEVTVTFNYPVVILPGAFLLLDTGNAVTSPGAANYLSGNESDSLTFIYTVVEGDESSDLGTYDDGDIDLGGGLVGTVLRDSDNPTQVC